MRRKLTFQAKKIDRNHAYTGRLYILDVTRRASDNPEDARQDYAFWIGLGLWEIRVGYEYKN